MSVWVLRTCTPLEYLIQNSGENSLQFCSSWKAALLEILFKVQELHNFLCSPLPPLELGVTAFHCRVITYSALPSLSVAFVSLLGIAFTKDGRYMAVAERRDCKDFVSLFVCSDWQLLRHFDTETQDLFGIEWAPNGCVLAVWDTCLEYKILLYSLDGRLLSTYRAYEWSLGIKSIAWSPSSQFLAIGSYDEKVRILNHVTWKKIAEFEHPATVVNTKTVVYKEVEKPSAVEMERLSFPPTRALASSLFSTQSKYDISQVPVSFQYIKPVADRANPKMGIGMLAFSPDNCFLATKNDNIPNAVWIWDIQKLKLSVVLEQLCAIQSFQWDPRQPRLAVCTGNSKVYLWSPAGCVSVQVPMEGKALLLALRCWRADWHYCNRNKNSMLKLLK
uniref:WD repeat-containing protein WRAP73 n=1 Tax=Cairina moschata TaxID=8855 RepID=A0A8C3C9Q0_CAIMO